MNCRSGRILVLLVSCFATSALLAQDADDHQGVSNMLGAGARAWGMGGAFIALADDATAASWNPAGLAQLSKPEVSLVSESGKGDLEWRYRYTTRGDTTQTYESVRDTGRTDYSAVSFASATYPYDAAGRRVVVQLSYRRLSTFPGILNPYLTRTTTTPAAGSPNAAQTANLFETAYDGGFGSYGVSVAAPLGEKIKIGATANYVRGDVASTTLIGGGGLPDAARLGLTYAFSGIAFDFGALYAPTKKVSVGAVYHSGFSAPFWYESSLDTALAARTTAGRAKMRWPDGAGAGIAVKPTETFTISTDMSVTRWGKATVDRLDVANLAYDAAAGWQPRVTTFEKLGFPYFGLPQSDTTNTRLGIEYVTFYREVTLPVRAGVFRESQATNAWDEAGDAQPKPAYSGYTLGAGIAIGRIQADLAYVRTTGTDQGRNGRVDGATTTEYEFARVRNQRVILSALFRF